MKTIHYTYFGNSKKMEDLSDQCADLVVTSPPYPMIEMWDDIFSQQSAAVKRHLKQKTAWKAFEAMHGIMDEVWSEVFRILKPGGFACINIGDATRTIKEKFCLYPNHSRILSAAMALGFTPLPCILWRKQTNAPNKFMGSGMLPAGAYVTLEHEYVLILRKKNKRSFLRPEQKKCRRESALFWEERNTWFSDVWFDIKGTRQALGDKGTRKRSAAFPFELAYRLINMYSVKGDLVVDPFLGMGTTALAAMTAGRNSVGYEIDRGLNPTINHVQQGLIAHAQDVIDQRLTAHREFVARREQEKGPLKHENCHYGFPVITAQEKELFINRPLALEIKSSSCVEVSYETTPQTPQTKAVSTPTPKGNLKKKKRGRPKKNNQEKLPGKIDTDGQMTLF
ncbi:MAG: modification methylase [Desulfobacterales bacterium]|nr:MAG: modification methylase [Desulfobacterales bacterium]